MRETLNDFYPGSMDNEETEKADRKLMVQFYMHHIPDFLATNGGEVPNDTPEMLERIAELEKLGCKARVHKKWSDIMVVSGCGRPVYHEVEFIRIMKPGDRDNIVERPVTEDDRMRFKTRYDRWKAGEHMDGVVGTPLDELPFVDSAQREEFKFYGIRTVEQLVGMPDGTAARFPGVRAIQHRAEVYLAAAEKKAPFEAIHKEMAERDQRVTELEALVAELKAKLAPPEKVARK